MYTVAIVGGGVSGLALAAALDPARFRVRLIEAEPDRPQLATVYGMWPHALRALARLGLDAQVRESGLPAGGASLFTRSGRRLSQARGPRDAWLIPRPRLLALLDAAVPESVERQRTRVSDPHTLEADLVVGADGVHSRVRHEVWGKASRPTGTMALRGVIDGEVTDHNPGHRGLHEFWGRGLLFGITPNTCATTNWYAAMREFDADPASGLAWARANFADFPEPVRRVLSQAQPTRTVVNRIVEAPTLCSLVRDRFVLIGDAAHAMSPNLGRGACEALVDGITLAHLLNQRPPDDALRRFQRRRLIAGQGVRLASGLVRRVAVRA